MFKYFDNQFPMRLAANEIQQQLSLTFGKQARRETPVLGRLQKPRVRRVKITKVALHLRPRVLLERPLEPFVVADDFV